MANRELEDGDAEGFGIVFIEANSCGKPVIAGKCNGALDAVEDGVSGLLVNSSNPDDISEKINYLLAHERIRIKLGQDGRKRALEKFQWEKNIAEFKEKFSVMADN